jgi:tRNA 2-thiouridine synthesizing protein A
MQGTWVQHPTGAPKERRLASSAPSPQDACMSETLLDMKGTTCPIPVLRANRALRSMAPGERLRVLATDRASVADFQAFCRETGHALLAWSEENGVFSFVIRRRAEDPAPKED